MQNKTPSFLTGVCLAASTALILTAGTASAAPAAAEARPADPSSITLSSSAYRLAVGVVEGSVWARLEDLRSGCLVSDGPVLYRATAEGTPQRLAQHLEDPSVEMRGRAQIVRGKLLGLDVEHRFTLPPDRPIVEERVTLTNNTKQKIALADLEIGMQRRIADASGKPAAELAADRLIAVPLRHRANYAKGQSDDFSFEEIATRPGRVVTADRNLVFHEVSSPHRVSEGWAWTHGDDVLGIFKFCQEHLQFSVVSTHRRRDGIFLRLGGAVMIADEPAALHRIGPGETVDLGVVRYQTLRGGHREACYAFRAMLDEFGCRFPRDYNPPVHWEQLYDMNGAWDDRAHRYTKAIVEREAALGRAYHCEALYLDPGWDTTFGSFLWGEKWLGPRRQFIEEMKSKYGLQVSLHCPLATWVSIRGDGIPLFGPSALGTYPAEARRTPPNPKEKGAEWPMLCLGSKQYLATAEERLLANCADGVAFLMFDGNWWNGGCLNPSHGHPVPYRMEDHIRANLDLAQRIHAKYPKVLIEMHDMICGGAQYRLTPLYYKYGLPGSYDENWGFELMWNPMDDIVQGRVAALYYANLGCNVPIYTHVSLTRDNPHCLILWWYASTCRHLGIGGKNRDPKIVAAEQAAMAWYRAHDRFYKRGDFYGITEEIHLHVLPRENAFTVNVFNLSDKKRTIRGTVELKTLGLDPARAYVSPERLGTVENGRYQVEIELPPWGAKAGAFAAR